MMIGIMYRIKSILQANILLTMYQIKSNQSNYSPFVTGLFPPLA